MIAIISNEMEEENGESFLANGYNSVLWVRSMQGNSIYQLRFLN